MHLIKLYNLQIKLTVSQSALPEKQHNKIKTLKFTFKVNPVKSSFLRESSFTGNMTRGG